MGVEDTVAAYIEAAREFLHVVSSAMLRLAREVSELQEQVEHMNERLVSAETVLHARTDHLA